MSYWSLKEHTTTVLCCSWKFGRELGHYMLSKVFLSFFFFLFFKKGGGAGKRRRLVECGKWFAVFSTVSLSPREILLPLRLPPSFTLHRGGKIWTATHRWFDLTSFFFYSGFLAESPWLQHLMWSCYVSGCDEECFIYLPYLSCCCTLSSQTLNWKRGPYTLTDGKHSC